MTLENLMISDYNDLKRYFQKKIEFFKQTIFDEQDIKIEESESCVPIGISHFIKPDMIINIYSFLEFYLQEICKQCKNKYVAYPLDYRDIKGKNDLDAYNKYLTKYIGLKSDMQNVYERLDKLRTFRNIFIHQGSHITGIKKELDKLDNLNGKKINGITITILKFNDVHPNDNVNAMITVTDDYIFNCLDDAKLYLESICHNIQIKDV